MATTVYNVEEVTLQDDTKVTLKPLPIKKLRRFMTAWEKMAKLEDDDQGLDVFIECAGVGLETQLKKKVTGELTQEDGENNSEFESRKEEVWQEYLEDTLDLPTIHKILEVCGGLKLNDPNLQAAMEAAVARMEDGQN